MKLILCVDDKGGLAFNHRRQSRDRVLNRARSYALRYAQAVDKSVHRKAVRSGYGSTALHR